ncbi:MAG: iron-only hydrogenase system regulator [Treponema sp.]|jgi:putative iron-only hydrogenase system regulator|nr:iron-only hydrogenase system regulator [Treponema sp.]
MERIAVIGAILEKPRLSQKVFNETVAAYRRIVKGRMGIPFDDEDVSVVALTLRGEIDDINALTGKLGNLPHVTVKTAVGGLRAPRGDACFRETGKEEK